MPPKDFCASLFNTIKALTAASSNTRYALLRQMQSELQIQHLPMSDAEFLNIIEFLNDYMQRGLLNAEALDGIDLSGFILDKNYHNISRSAAIVFNPHRQVYDLVVFSGAYFYDSNNQITEKYSKEYQKNIIGSGVFKKVKKVVCIRFENQQFKIMVIACASENISEFSTKEDSIVSLNKAIHLVAARGNVYRASTFTEIDNAVMELWQHIPSFKRWFLNYTLKITQLEIAKVLSGVDNLAAAVYVRPCIKQQSKPGHYKLKLYSFDGIAKFGDMCTFNNGAQQHIGNIIAQSPSEERSLPTNLEDIIDDLAAALHEMHARGVVHADFKPSNILLEKNLQPRIIDYGASIDIENTKTKTKKLLRMLGYSKVGNGTIEGHMLDPMRLRHALMIVELYIKNGKFAAIHEIKVPTFDSVNAKLNDICENLEVNIAVAATTYDYASPEVYALHKKTYYKDIARVSLASIVVGFFYDRRIIHEMDNKINTRTDTWALGIAILNIIFDLYIKKGSLDLFMILAEYNPALKALLEPDVDKRATIAEFIELRKQYPLIKFPPRSEFVILHAKYIKSMKELEKKLADTAKLRQAIDKMRTYDFLNSQAHMNYLQAQMRDGEFLSDEKKAELFLNSVFDVLAGIKNNPVYKVEDQFCQILEFVLPGLNYTAAEMLANMINGKFAPDTMTVQLIANKLLSFVPVAGADACAGSIKSATPPQPYRAKYKFNS